jgi:hypothetical protein
MTSIFDGHGYFYNDDRNSGGKLDEDDLLGCGHCPKPLKKAEWKQQGGMCMVCNKPLCIHCYRRAIEFGCSGPEIARFEKELEDRYRREQNAKILGI